jgi:hypothetical protein
MVWHSVADTALPSPADFSEPGKEPLLGPAKTITLTDRSTVILLGRQP